MQDFDKKFIHPPKEYRPAPFWSWNDDLDENELIRQIKEFKEKGFGGFFMHSRTGLITEYMSDKWDKLTQACINESKSLDLEAWFYDEDKWPSGFAGGKVPAMDESFRARGLKGYLITGDEWNKLKDKSDIINAFNIIYQLDTEYDKIEYKSFEIINNNTNILNDNKILYFKIKISPKTMWYNNETYTNLLNPKAVEAFIETTYKHYGEKFKSDIGKVVPGIFTDEPNFGDIPEVDIPWTEDLREEFEKRYNYDIIDNLPSLVYPLGDYKKIRHNFYSTLTRRFIDSYAKQIYNACKKYNMKLTGHYLEEDSLLKQTKVIGAAMPFYEYMDFPGIDHLGRNINDFLTKKQVSSVSNQLGKERTISELFAGCGHSVTFAELMWIADSNFVLGINYLCPHLSLYSMKGKRKRDYPPTFSYHQPYFKYFKILNDYLARVSTAIRFGKNQSNTLLLHPITSAWAQYAAPVSGIPSRSVQVKELDISFGKLFQNLLELHIDIELGDEFIMENHAKVDGDTIQIGEMQYKQIIIPSSITWNESTVKLLDKFTGLILIVGEVPDRIDGEEADFWIKFLKRKNVVHVYNNKDEISSAMKKIGFNKFLSITGKDDAEINDIFYRHSRDNDNHMAFIFNYNRKLYYQASITINALVEDFYEYNPLNGKKEAITGITYDKKKSTTHITLNISGGNSKIIYFKEAKDIERLKEIPKVESSAKFMQTISDPWDFSRTRHNSLTLDFGRLKIDEGNFRATMPIAGIRATLIEHSEAYKYNGIQPWKLIKDNINIPSHPTWLLWEFECDFKDIDIPSIYFVLEDAKGFTIKVNDIEISNKSNDWYIDMSYSKIDITKHVKNGVNTIEMYTDYNIHSIIEQVYLFGDFAVRRKANGFILNNEEKELKRGDWTDQGYPFYAGNMIYKKTIDIDDINKRYSLRFPDWNGTMIIFRVNGEELQIDSCPTYKVILDNLVNGKNEIEIEVTGSLRNLMGPLHHKQKDNIPLIGPRQFLQSEDWMSEYNFVPQGLFSNIELWEE